MDILAHGLWAGVAAQAVRRRHRSIRVRFAVAWGIAPDLAAFGILFVVLLAGLAQGEPTWARLADYESMARAALNGHPLLQISSALYTLGHSALIFLAAFGAVWLAHGRPRWEMAAWGLHILLDIPTHARSFYPTPVLWPLVDWTVDGVSWTVPWVFALNYAALALAWGWFWLAGKRPAGNGG